MPVRWERFGFEKLAQIDARAIPARAIEKSGYSGKGLYEKG